MLWFSTDSWEADRRHFREERGSMLLWWLFSNSFNGTFYYQSYTSSFVCYLVQFAFIYFFFIYNILNSLTEIWKPSSEKFSVAIKVRPLTNAVLRKVNSPQITCAFCSGTWSTAAAELPGCSLFCTGPVKSTTIIWLLLFNRCAFCQPKVMYKSVMWR